MKLMKDLYEDKSIQFTQEETEYFEKYPLKETVVAKKKVQKKAKVMIPKLPMTAQTSVCIRDEDKEF